jgi:hypothetical protein
MCMDATIRLYANALRTTALTVKLARIDTTAAASGRDPGPEFHRLLTDARVAVTELRAWSSAALMRGEVERARARFQSR